MGMFSRDEEDTYTRPYVVRCKNCEHWEEGSVVGKCHDPKLNDDVRFTSPEFYCADGEERMSGWKCMICSHSYRNLLSPNDLFCSMTGNCVTHKSDWCSDFERKEECRYGTP